MDYIPIEKLLQQSKGSLYKLVVMVAKRARQLAGGEKPLIENSNPDKPLRTSLEEVKRGFIEIN